MSDPIDMEFKRLHDRIEELEAANELLLDKWERQECSWCGTNQGLAWEDDDDDDGD